MRKVSVLVAVYNSAEYLPSCLDSLRRQTHYDLQIICVDDCSTDSSLSLLRQYEAEDSRIEVIHLDQNSGQAHARNVALQQATGLYICFLDSDDWLADDALEQAVKTFEEHPQTDSVLFQVVYYEQETGNHSDYGHPTFEVLTGKEAFMQSLDWKIHGIYMVRGDLHKHYPYDETSRAYSDDNTTRIHYYYSREVRCCHGKYYYRNHSSSVTRKATIRRFDYLRANESMRHQLIALGAGQDALSQYENHRWLNLIDVYLFYYLHGRELTPDDRSYGRSELRRVWEGIDRQALDTRITRKLGYHPFRHWWMFQIEEWIYFTLRGLLGKNK